MSFQDRFDDDWQTKELNEHAARLKVGDFVIIDTRGFNRSLLLVRVTAVKKQYFEADCWNKIHKFNLASGIERGKDRFDSWAYHAFPATPANLDKRDSLIKQMERESEAQKTRYAIGKLCEQIEAQIRRAGGERLEALRCLHSQLEGALNEYAQRKDE